jgi:hypothetical protein
MLATPVVTIVAVLSLALGIGANTAIFSSFGFIARQGVHRVPMRNRSSYHGRICTQANRSLNPQINTRSPTNSVSTPPPMQSPSIVLFDRLNTQFEDQLPARDQIVKFLETSTPTTASRFTCSNRTRCASFTISATTRRR